MGWVYLLGDTRNDNIYKIGVTTGDIEKRMRKLQTGNVGEIFLCDKYETQHPFLVEHWLHTHFFKENERGEWFELSMEQRKEFQALCEKYDKASKLGLKLKENI